MLDIYSESGAGRLVILGDILYHGPAMTCPGNAPKGGDRDAESSLRTRFMQSGKLRHGSGPDGSRVSHNG